MAKKNKSATINRAILAVIGVIVISLVFGWLGGKLGHGGGGSSSSDVNFAATPFLDQIKSKGELRVGIAENPPFEGRQKDGTLDGPDLLPLKQLATSLHVKYVTVPADWSNIVAGLQANRYDFAADLTATNERAQSIQFSQNLYSYDNIFLVKSDSSYVTANDVIKGGTIVSVNGIAANDSLKATGAKMMNVDSNANQISALKAGRAIAAYLSLPAAIDIAQKDSSYKLIVPDPPIYRAGSAYGVAANVDPRSLQIINITIQNAIDSGELRQAFAKAGLRFDTSGLDNLVKK